MLPEILSNDLCSLREGVDRLTLTVEMRIDNAGNIRYQAFNRASYGWTGVSPTIWRTKSSTRGKKSSLYDHLRAMYGLAARLHASRIEQGSLELNMTDESLIYESNVVTDIRYMETS